MQTNRYVDGTYLRRVFDWHASDSHWKARNVAGLISRNHLFPKSVYDIGCGAGQVLVELSQVLGPQVCLLGLDISPQAIAIAKSRNCPGIGFEQGDYLMGDYPVPDLILLLDVFEHVPDYLGFLTRLQELSRQVIFHIPLDIVSRAVVRKSSYMLYMRKNYGHLHYFTQETALETLADTGFRVIDQSLTDDYDISEWWKTKSLRPWLLNWLRQAVKKARPDLAAALFSNFNLLVLAEGGA